VNVWFFWPQWNSKDRQLRTCERLPPSPPELLYLSLSTPSYPQQRIFSRVTGTKFVSDRCKLHAPERTPTTVPTPTRVIRLTWVRSWDGGRAQTCAGQRRAS
jgi:hypothetical protein